MSWREVTAEKDIDVLFIGTCDYCGCDRSDIWRSAKAMGGPILRAGYDGNHREVRDCIRALSERIIAIEKQVRMIKGGV